MMPQLLFWKSKATNGALIVALLAALIPGAARAEPCNPIIDGTYCATQMPRSNKAQSSGGGMNPIRSIGSDFGSNTSQDSPGTLGSISFGGGSRCIGSMIRSRCS